MSKVIGIDLGTTNSVVSVLEAGEPKVDADHLATVPREKGVLLRTLDSAVVAFWAVDHSSNLPEPQDFSR